jgi:HSP20 family protein
MRLVHYTYPNYRALTPNGFVRSPWSGLDEEISRLLTPASSGGTVSGGFPVELHEDQTNAYVRAELPGVRREDINVELADGALTITATRKLKNGDHEEPFTLSRTVTVPEAVQAEKITAVSENGVLTVILPKAEAIKPRKIVVG